MCVRVCVLACGNLGESHSSPATMPGDDEYDFLFKGEERIRWPPPCAIGPPDAGATLNECFFLAGPSLALTHACNHIILTPNRRAASARGLEALSWLEGVRGASWWLDNLYVFIDRFSTAVLP